MVVLNMKGIGQVIDEGTYPVILDKVTEKKTAKNDDMITFRVTIKGSDSDFEGRPLFRNFVIPTATKAGEDISASLYYLQRAFMVFGADEDDVTSEEFNPVALGPSLAGTRAKAVVKHNPNEDPDKPPYLNIEFQEDDF